MDGTYAKAHQHLAGAVGPAPQAIGKSRAGLTTTLHLAVDAYGRPVEFRITGGQVHDSVVAPVLIARLTDAQAIVGDKGYDSARIRDQIAAQDSQCVIPRKRNSVLGNDDLDRRQPWHATLHAFHNDAMNSDLLTNPPERNLDEYLNGDLKRRIHCQPPAKDAADITRKTCSCLRSTQPRPAPIRSYFQDAFVKYTA